MIRVVLADDEHLLRSAVSALLDLEPDIEVVAEASNGSEAVAAACEHRADVAVLDLQMPDQDGIASAEAIIRQLPDCRVLIVTGHGLPGYLKRALKAGVHGFAPKSISAQDMSAIIRSLHAGSRYIDAELAADAISAGESPLTNREADLLSLAADGVTVNEIAERAALTPGTARNYLSSAATKLGAKNRYRAVHIAQKNGWI
ncbi:DNA-binding response regulator [Streptomyces sp. NPDC057554]|uniref:response regulator transcription factor n=1 Tax=Streptomycetaceae TaxID=2062 RepID=UPI001FCA40F0